MRAVVHSRRQAFKGRLNRLSERMHAATDAPLTFTTRGSNPRSTTDHLNQILLPAMATTWERNRNAARLLNTGRWDPNAPDCIQTFTELVRILDAEIDFISDLCGMMPPLELRAVHRELARAVPQFARGHVLLAQTIIAVDADEADRIHANVVSAMADGRKHLERATALMRLIERSPSDGPFRADGSLDVAALAWSGVSLKTTSVKDAAKLVRDAFVDIPGVPGLADEHAVLLLSMLSTGVGVVDSESLSRRVRQLRAVVDAADPSATWVKDPTLLVARVNRGIERSTLEIERLGREWRYGLPRNHVMNSLTEVYRNLVEGALRDLGGIVLVAARAGRSDENRTYERDVVDGIIAGEVVTELERIDAPCGGVVNMLYRNASAHADVEVTDAGIVVTERRIERGREVSRDQEALSDDEFAEEMVALQEILLALQLIILPWLWSTSYSDLATAVACAAVTKRQRDQTIALLGGMAGLHDLALSEDGHRATISATSHDDHTDRRESSILSLVPAAFGVLQDAQEVSLGITGLRPVTFNRTEFLDLELDDAPHKLPMLGLLTARWLLESDSSWSERDEATYIAFPLTMLHFACYRLADSIPQPTENLDQAVDSLHLVLSRLDHVLMPDRRSQLTRRAVEQVTILLTSLIGLAESRRGQRSHAEGERLARQAVATVEPMYEIQEEAKIIRDSAPPTESIGTA